MLPFGRGANIPLGVLKVARQRERNALTEEEQITLAKIRNTLDPQMRRTIPEPMGTVRLGELSAGLESCAAGRLLSTSTSSWRAPLKRKIDDLQLAVEWLTEFHRQVQFGREWTTSELRDWVEKPFEEYARVFGLEPAETRLFRAVRQYAERLIGSVLPQILVHWNFSMSHIFRSGRLVTVVDWEGVVPGPALLDLLFFIVRWTYAVRKLHDDDAEVRGFLDLFCDTKQSDTIFAAVHQAISQYIARLGIDRRFLPLILVVMCVVRALGRFNRRERDNESHENARAGNLYVRYISVLSVNADQLLSTDTAAAHVSSA
jgi:hypothetical protein